MASESGRQSVEDWLRDRLGALLQRPAAQVEIRRRFVEFGIESLEATTISVELEEWLGLRLPLTLLWDHPTVAELAAHLETLRGGSGSRSTSRLRGVRSRGDPGEVLAVRADARVSRARGAARGARVRRIDNPYFHEHGGMLRDSTVIGGLSLLSFNGYNYQGQRGHPEIEVAAIAALRRYGTSVAASRAVGGERPIHRELEEELAAFLGVDHALLFVAGFGANVSSIAGLVGPQDLIVHDQFVHSSIMQGGQLSGARMLPFKHNDWKELDRILEEKRGSYEKVLIAVEGLYSADGDVCPLPQLVQIKRRHKAWLYVDDAHGFGTLGRRGRGAFEHTGDSPRDIDLTMLTLSKTLSSTGGAVAGSAAVIKYLRYTAYGFSINSVGMPRRSQLGSDPPERCESYPARTRGGSRSCRRSSRLLRPRRRAPPGLDLGTCEPGVATKPVYVRDDVRCLRASSALLARGLDVHPVIFPAVAAGSARLRLFVTVEHTEEQIDRAIAWTVEALA